MKIEFIVVSFSAVFSQFMKRLLRGQVACWGCYRESKSLGTDTRPQPTIAAPFLHGDWAQNSALVEVCLVCQDPVKEDTVSLANSEAVTEARGHSDPADSAGGAHPAGLAQRQTLMEAGGILSLAATTKHPHSSLIKLAS